MTRYFLLAVMALFSTLQLRADECPKSKFVSHTTKSDGSSTSQSIVKTAASAGQFQTLLTLLIAADLDDALKGKGSFTVFAPTDEAFAKLPKGTLETLLKPENKDQLKSILTYHVIPNKASFAYDNAQSNQRYEFKTLNGSNVTLTRGDGVFRVNDAKITTQNIACTNGSIQIINTVLMPPAKSTNTIVGVAQKAKIFQTLVAALTVAELTDVLNGEGPFTVFAPTDDAFAGLPKGTLERLLKPENRKQLVNILKYHVVPGRVSAAELVRAGRVQTLQGESVRIAIAEGRVAVNRSGFAASDISADNGVVHVINSVLMPSH